MGCESASCMETKEFCGATWPPKALKGNEDFGELVERHFGRVFRTTRRITRHREDAEDVVQGE